MMIITSFLRIEDKPYLTFFIRTVTISLITALFLIIIEPKGKEIMESLTWLVGCSLFIGLLISFIAGICEIGRENVER